MRHLGSHSVLVLSRISLTNLGLSPDTLDPALRHTSEIAASTAWICHLRIIVLECGTGGERVKGVSNWVCTHKLIGKWPETYTRFLYRKLVEGPADSRHYPPLP